MVSQTDMTEKQQRQLRSTRLSARTRQGKIPHEVEPVEVLTCHGSNAKVCGKLVYLGTLLVPNCSATPEIYRRCDMACDIFYSLIHVWNSLSINTITEGKLCQALIHSARCYNGECWPVSKNDLQHLKGTNFRLYDTYREPVEDHSSAVQQADEHISRDRVL